MNIIFLSLLLYLVFGCNAQQNNGNNPDVYPFYPCEQHYLGKPPPDYLRSHTPAQPLVNGSQLVFIPYTSQNIEINLHIELQQEFFKATIDGTMLTLWKCDPLESTCLKEDEGGVKTRPYITPYKWNYITATFVQAYLHAYKIEIAIGSRDKVITMDVLHPSMLDNARWSVWLKFPNPVSSKKPNISRPQKPSIYSVVFKCDQVYPFTSTPTRDTISPWQIVPTQPPKKGPGSNPNPPLQPYPGVNPNHPTNPHPGVNPNQPENPHPGLSSNHPANPHYTTPGPRGTHFNFQPLFTTTWTSPTGHYVFTPNHHVTQPAKHVDHSTPVMPPMKKKDNVGLIIGILCGIVLFIIICYAIYNLYKKKKSASINEHSKLKEDQSSQQQQQQQQQQQNP